MDNLPPEMVYHILRSDNFDNTVNLCESSKSFREQCNKVAMEWIKQHHPDPYKLYWKIRRTHAFDICVSTAEGQTRFKTVSKFNRIKDNIVDLLQELDVVVYRTTDITFSTDSMRRPTSCCINFHNYNRGADSLEDNLSIFINGFFENYQQVDDLVGDIADQMKDN